MVSKNAQYAAFTRYFDMKKIPRGCWYYPFEIQSLVEYFMNYKKHIAKVVDKLPNPFRKVGYHNLRRYVRKKTSSELLTLLVCMLLILFLAGIAI